MSDSRFRSLLSRAEGRHPRPGSDQRGRRRAHLRRLIAIATGLATASLLVLGLPAAVMASTAKPAVTTPKYPTPSAAARHVTGGTPPAGTPPAPKAAQGYKGALQAQVGYTSFSHTVRAGKGYSTQFYARPEFRQTAGGWQQIDPTISATGNSSQPEAAPEMVRPVRFGNGSQNVVQLELANGPVTLQAKGMNVGKPTLNGQQVVYSNVATDTDLEYQVSSGMIEEDLVLHSSAAPTSFSRSRRVEAICSAARSPATWRWSWRHRSPTSSPPNPTFRCDMIPAPRT